MHVGFFESEVEAARAHDSYIIKRFGDQPSKQVRLNFGDIAAPGVKEPMQLIAAC